jgi:hypothetical protein
MSLLNSIFFSHYLITGLWVFTEHCTTERNQSCALFKGDNHSKAPGNNTDPRFFTTKKCLATTFSKTF